MFRPLLICSAVLCSAAALDVIDLRSDIPLHKKISVQVCAGLSNRNPSTPVYTVLHDSDIDMIDDTQGISDLQYVDLDDFLKECLAIRSKGFILFNATSQQEIVPQLIALAGLLDAVLIEDEAFAIGAVKVIDALRVFQGFSEYMITKYLFENYINETTTLAFMNPGWETTKVISPILNGSPDIGLADYIVKEKLFNMYLKKGCIPFTDDFRLLERITQNNPWKRPIPVLGYNNGDMIAGGYVFEAGTNCHRDMGTVATDGVNNLSYFSRTPRISKPLVQNKANVVFNSSKTYLTLIVGDGDNVRFLKDSIRSFMKKRVSKCNEDPLACFPLVWSISPHTLYLAPDWIRWYFSQAHTTGNDFFILPPSGALYAYPSLMSEENQVRYVHETEEYCQLLNTSGIVSWEWFLDWPTAIKSFFPKFAINNIVKACFAVNVPFIIPILGFREKERYKVIHSKTLLFNQREWRGEAKSSIPFSQKSYLSPNLLAEEINAYAKGTVSNIYVTSDGGANIESLINLTRYLDEHVQIVDQESLVKMAFKREQVNSLYDIA